MATTGFGYFDETYFQDGTKRGTAYVNYKEGARESRTFREIASAAVEIFRPKRVLDVGCATGTTVRWLNEQGCEAYGIDVSEWAVNNAEHPNVRLASADHIPFPDGFFDLVLSCHSMEHFPDSLVSQSLREITRVGSHYFFHMLPMVGTPPYVGEPEEVRRQLRKDPTHQQLHPKEWWLNSFRALGCIPLETCVLFENETVTAELSNGQFLLRKGVEVDEQIILRSTLKRNQRVYRELQLKRVDKLFCGSDPLQVVYSDRLWREVERRLEGGDALNLVGRSISVVAIVEGSECSLRFAAGNDSATTQWADVGQIYFSIKPGCNMFTFPVDQLSTLRGSPDYSSINHLALGGENENTKITFYVSDQHGRPIF